MRSSKLLTIVGSLVFLQCGGSDPVSSPADAGPDARNLGVATIRLGSPGIGVVATGEDGQLIATTTTSQDGIAEID